MAEVSEIRQELSLVCPSDIVYSDPGHDAVLSCHLKPAISAASMEIKWWKKEDLVCHYKDGQMIESCEDRVSLSLEDLHKGNVSLTLKNVRRSQRGHYICKVIHECKTIKEYVFLHISSEDFSLVVPTGLVFDDPGSDVILPVHLSPETSAVSMEIRWSRGTDLIYHYNNRQEKTNSDYENQMSLSIQELERGKLSLTLRNVQQTDSGKYTCRVFHDGCQQTGVVHLQVRVEESCMANKSKRLEMELSAQLKELERGSAPKRRRRNSMNEDRPLMSDDGTLEKHERMIPVEPEEEMEPVQAWGLLPDLPSECLLIETVISSAINWTHVQENPGATRTQQQEGIATEQEISTPDTQSQEQERERPSESLTAGDATQTPERPEER